MSLPVLKCGMLAVSHQITGSYMKSFKDTDTAVGVASRLQVGQLRDSV